MRRNFEPTLSFRESNSGCSGVFRRKTTKHSGGFPREKKTQKFSSPHKRSRVLRKNKLNIVFMGTPEFACFSLEELMRREKVAAVVTQPDKPGGRGKKIKPPPVKLIAYQNNIPIYQPEDLKNPVFLEKIFSLHPDLIVVVAFGKLLPPELVNAARIYSINLHPSLLPKYKGPSPIVWALINGERETGVTIQKIGRKIDSGEIILQKKMLIDPEDTAGTLTEKLSHLGAEALIEAINLIKDGKAKLKPQKGEESYAPKITKEAGRIKWEKTSREIHNLVRGLNPYPGAFTTFYWKEKLIPIKIWKTDLYEKYERLSTASPGEVVDIIKNKGFIVKTGKGVLLIREVQLPGKSKINAYEFVKGYHIKKGLKVGGEK